MSTTKHTSGWRIVSYSDPHTREIHDNFGGFCSCMADKANLLVAAPELLEACKALLDLTLPSRCNVRPHEDCGCYSCQQYNAIEFIQAAIDKATKGEAEPEPNEQEANYDLHASDGLD